MKHLPQRGFTIIELLVIATVVGILATIAVLGVRGAQVQARNAETGTIIQSYKKALEKYLNDNGSYPIPNGTACLGEGYGDYDGDGTTGDCWHITWVAKENTSFNSLIKPYMNNSLPVAGKILFKYPPYDQIGAIFSYEGGATLDGQPHTWWIGYTMEGGATKCPVGPVASFAPSGWPNFSSTPPASGYTEGYGEAATGCWLPMPDPTKL